VNENFKAEYDGEGFDIGFEMGTEFLDAHRQRPLLSVSILNFRMVYQRRHARMEHLLSDWRSAQAFVRTCGI
jgi:hypothetical protein